MAISAQDRAALNDPGQKATESRYAYRSQSGDKPTYYAGEAWARKHGFDFAAVSRADGASAAPAGTEPY
jgi:cytochrome c oxidase cbb3-type subunit 2